MERQATTLTVEVPKYALLDLAASGHMGTGEVLTMTRQWAEQACIKAGWKAELDELRKKRLDATRTALRNLLGDEQMNKIDAHISAAVKAMTGKV